MIASTVADTAFESPFESYAASRLDSHPSAIARSVDEIERSDIVERVRSSFQEAVEECRELGYPLDPAIRAFAVSLTERLLADPAAMAQGWLVPPAFSIRPNGTLDVVLYAKPGGEQHLLEVRAPGRCRLSVVQHGRRLVDRTFSWSC